MIAGSGVRVTVTDPLATGDSIRGGGVGFLYLFRQSGSALSPGAGKDYVDYDFAPSDPMGHAESSTVSSDRYSTHFSARWTRDQIRSAPARTSSTGTGTSSRSATAGAARTPSRAGDGGYATNIDGPVRVIRSYLGANSGTYTQREHIFYRGAERVQTFLRVHAIPGILDFYDLSPAAVGMRYASSSTPAGVPIDGNVDTTGTAAPTWEAVTGSQGALGLDHRVADRHHRPRHRAYYRDDTTRPRAVHRGRRRVRRSGTAITSAIPNTDPTLGALNNLTATRWNVYVPGTEAPDVATRVANLTTPLTTSVATFVPGA